MNFPLRSTRSSLLVLFVASAALVACAKSSLDETHDRVVLVSGNDFGVAPSAAGGTHGAAGNSTVVSRAGAGGASSAGTSNHAGQTGEAGSAGEPGGGGIGGVGGAGDAAGFGDNANGGHELGQVVYSCDPLPDGVTACISGVCPPPENYCPPYPNKCGGPDGKQAINFGPHSCVEGSCTGTASREYCPIACIVGMDGTAVCTDTPPCNPYYWLSVCDPVCQDCTDPTMPKCSVHAPHDPTPTPKATGGLHSPPMDPTVAVCTAKTGTKAEGESCERDIIGEDDCLPGLLCTRWGFPTDPEATAPKTCRRFCHTQNDCSAANEACVIFDATQIPQAALCVPTCTPFDDSACVAADGMPASCSQTYLGTSGDDVEFTCREIPAFAGPGKPCSHDTDCDDHEMCLFDTTGEALCATLCDGAHPCKEGVTCHLVGPPTTAGFCQ